MVNRGLCLWVDAGELRITIKSDSMKIMIRMTPPVVPYDCEHRTARYWDGH